MVKKVDVSEEMSVELILEDTILLPPKVKGHAERAHALKDIAAHMQQHPFPTLAPDFTREELHVRC